MLVPVVVAANTSPSPANVPAAIDTVAPARSRLSGSDTVTLGDNVSTVDGTAVTAATTPPSAGGSLTAVMLPVEVAVPVELLAPPSLSVQVTVRVGAEP